MDSSMAHNYVPEEIISNILARLPAKPLARFKCVSRNWNCLISDSSFMKSRARRMILLPVYPLQAIDKTVTCYDMAYSTVRLHTSFVARGLFIGGSVNGIVLLMRRNDYGHVAHVDMILYNPLTRALKIVPYSYGNAYFMCGFGFGSTPDDLKIVRLRFKGYHVSNTKSCDVFSLKNGSWSRPLEIGQYSFHHPLGTFVDGFLYWLAYKNGFGNLIVALDLSEIVLSEIEIPHGSVLRILGTFKGRLCVIYDQINDSRYDLFVRNNNGFWESCLKQSYVALRSRRNEFEYRVMCILDEGKIVMRNNTTNQIIIFDMLKGLYIGVNTVEGNGLGRSSQTIEFVESWVSPSDLCKSLI